MQYLAPENYALIQFLHYVITRYFILLLGLAAEMPFAQDRYTRTEINA